jgi:SAM-dependent methyltransferase
MTALAAYEAGLAGAGCWTTAHGGKRRHLPVARWAGGADEHDRQFSAVARAGLPAAGTVLDAGCGAGRLTLSLAADGVRVLGVDISAVAVDLAVARGAHAVRGDLLADLPPAPAGWARRWSRILLADGNLGIGGDPVALLTRLRPALARGGRVVAEVRAGGGVVRGPAWIEAADETGRAIGGPVPWAWVGADAAAEVGAAAGLRLRGLEPTARRWIAVWEKP